MRLLLVLLLPAALAAALLQGARWTAGEREIQPQVVPRSVPWGDRVFARPSELRVWLRRRGANYERWAERHPRTPFTARPAELKARDVEPESPPVRTRYFYALGGLGLLVLLTLVFALRDSLVRVAGSMRAGVMKLAAALDAAALRLAWRLSRSSKALPAARPRLSPEARTSPSAPWRGADFEQHIGAFRRRLSQLASRAAAATWSSVRAAVVALRNATAAPSGRRERAGPSATARAGRSPRALLPRVESIGARVAAALSAGVRRARAVELPRLPSGSRAAVQTRRASALGPASSSAAPAAGPVFGAPAPQAPIAHAGEAVSRTGTVAPRMSIQVGRADDVDRPGFVMRVPAESYGVATDGARVLPPDDGAERHEECEIRWWRGYVMSEFYAAVQDSDTVVGVSPAFRWKGSSAPEATDRTLQAYEALVTELARQGWEPHGNGADGAWYATRFSRAVVRESADDPHATVESPRDPRESPPADAGRYTVRRDRPRYQG